MVQGFADYIHKARHEEINKGILIKIYVFIYFLNFRTESELRI